MTITAGQRVLAADLNAIAATPVGVPVPGSLAQSTLYSVCTSALTPTSGTLYLMGIMLGAGQSVGHIGFCTGATAASGPTHWWAALLDQSRVLQAHSADQTSSALPASTWQDLAMVTPYTATYSGQYYVGLTVVTSTTQPTILAPPNNPDGQFVTGANMPTPVPCGLSSTGLTAPGTDGSTQYLTPTAAGPVFFMYAAA